jgi:hypothetical protein
VYKGHIGSGGGTGWVGLDGWRFKDTEGMDTWLWVCPYGLRLFVFLFYTWFIILITLRIYELSSQSRSI